MDPFANEPTYPWNAVIVWNNPQGVQKVLYDRGYPPSATLQDMYDLTNKLLAADPSFEKDLLSADPNKDKIIKYFAPPSNEKHFSLCNLCKSNYTTSDINDFYQTMKGLPGDQLYRELDLMKDALRNAVSNNDNAKKDAIAARIDVLGSLLGMPPDSIVSAGGTGTISPTPALPKGEGANSQATTPQPGFSLQNLSTGQKAVGLVAVGVIGGLLLGMLFSGGSSK